jgi:hypothetical protein
VFAAAGLAARHRRRPAVRTRVLLSLGFANAF